MEKINDGSASSQRIYFLDNLKAFIILLMVVFHVALGYTTWDIKWWDVNDIQKSKFFDYFIQETDVYIMPIMFMIAGYFASMVLVKKGMALFWQDKLRRIVLPWIAGVLLIAPFISYSIIFSRTDTPPNYFSFWANDFWGVYYQQAHFWFLGILALFFLLLTIAYKLNLTYFEKPSQINNPSGWFFPSFALLTAVPFFATNLYFEADIWVIFKFILNIQPVRLGLYFCYFGLGVYAWKNAWFTPNGYNPRLLPWGISAITMLFIFMAYRVTFTLGTDIPVLFKAGHALTFAAFCLTATFAFIALFQRFFDSHAYLWRRLAANSYTIYFIHRCVVIPLAYTVQNLQLNIWIKYIGVSLASVILCFLIAEYIINPILSLGKRDDKKNTLIPS
jgi:glucan biosynthesis protein C